MSERMSELAERGELRSDLSNPGARKYGEHPVIVLQWMMEDYRFQHAIDVIAEIVRLSLRRWYNSNLADRSEWEHPQQQVIIPASPYENETALTVRRIVSFKQCVGWYNKWAPPFCDIRSFYHRGVPVAWHTVCFLLPNIAGPECPLL
jgi:hypothetical protein